MLTLTALSILGVLILLQSLTGLRGKAHVTAAIGLVLSALVAELEIHGSWHPYASLPLNGMVVWDVSSTAFSVLLLLTGAAVALLLPRVHETNGVPRAEMAALLVFSLTGGVALVSFGNLAMLFLGVEILSIPLYVMAAARKRDLAGNEAALKYFLTGAFASGFLLFGIALLYAGTGSFDLAKIRAAVDAQNAANALSPFVRTGSLFLIVALAFKIAAAPFHFYAPDVYEGAPNPVSAYLATGVKSAAMVAFFKLLPVTLGGISAWWSVVVVLLVVLSVTVGNFSALAQSSFKRLLAWSSVSHAGYLTLALFLPEAAGPRVLLVYLTAYTLATVPAFILLTAAAKNESDPVDALDGLAGRSRFAGAALAVAMFSLAGIPLTSGFFGKWALFSGAAGTGHLALVIIALAASAVSLGYYLKPVIAAWFRPSPDERAQPLQWTGAEAAVVLVFTAANVVFGVFPDLLYRSL